jgi:hypothetical protein
LPAPVYGTMMLPSAELPVRRVRSAGRHPRKRSPAATPHGSRHARAHPPERLSRTVAGHRRLVARRSDLASQHMESAGTPVSLRGGQAQPALTDLTHGLARDLLLIPITRVLAGIGDSRGVPTRPTNSLQGRRAAAARSGIRRGQQDVGETASRASTSTRSSSGPGTGLATLRVKARRSGRPCVSSANLASPSAPEQSLPTLVV